MRFVNSNFIGLVVQIDASQFVRLKTIQELSQFQLPPGIVIDENYLAFTQAMLNKLNGIQANAQVNVKPDWNALPSAANGILNRPNGLMVIYDTKTVFVGDVFGAQEITVFIENVPTANYQVIPTFFDAATQGGTYTYSITERTQSQFKIRLRETGNFAQNLTMTCYVVAL
jgi:hypothetical protein